ncbi:MAG: hypothetical protein GXP62_10035 [Oligoflexia bacterium]|nr:hypothetical protein [Oligoflexia bacterium]
MIPGAWLSLLLAAHPALAADLALGLGADFVSDPSDRVEPLSDSRAGLGGQLRVPFRVGLGHGAWLRASLHSSLSRGQDRVEWTQSGGTATFYSDDHLTLVNSTALMVGPQVDIGHSDTVRPYLGGQLGAALVTDWHSFHGDAAVLLDPSQGDVTSGAYLDPFTRQLAPMVDVFAGARFLPSSPVAIEVEAGYTLSFLDQAALKKSRPELDAVRMAYGLNAIRVGLAAVFSL